MFSRITCARAAAVAATAGLALLISPAGAQAATAEHAVDGTTVSVTFTTRVLDLCGAALTPTGYAPSLANIVLNDNLSNILGLLDDPNITLLKDDVTGTLPTVAPTIFGPATVEAKNVEPDFYALVTFCASEGKPKIQTIKVGNDLDAITGSLGTMSADPGAGSSVLSSALGGGDE